MPTGREEVAYDDIGRRAVPQKIDGVTLTYDATTANGIPAAVEGRALTNSGNDTVALAADGDAVIGMLEKIEFDGFATVRVEGFAVFGAGASATVTRDSRAVGALGGTGGTKKGFIRSAASATAAELVKAGPIIVNNADTAAVVVRFP